VKILIPGIAGGLARQVARQLHSAGHQVIGIDARPWPNAPAGIEIHTVDLRKRGAEEVFRHHRPQVVVHMATVSAVAMPGEERYRINLGGTQAVFEHCAAHGVEHCIVVGRHTFYGAGPNAPLYHRETEPPLELGAFPELADLVASDLFAETALWRQPKLVTSVLRFCYTLGPSGHGTLAGFLRARRVPAVLGFDPLFQFLHEEDVVAAIQLCAEKRPRGVFNVTGPEPLPLSVIAKAVGRPRAVLPEAILAAFLGRRGLPGLPRGALAHIKYPVVCDGSLWRLTTGFEHRFDARATLEDFARTFPPAR
jgi:UDP-glucose 4-epimerase